MIDVPQAMMNIYWVGWILGRLSRNHKWAVLRFPVAPNNDLMSFMEEWAPRLQMTILVSTPAVPNVVYLFD
jgi:hypothetical protein